MSKVAGAMRRRTLIILGIAAGASALLGAASFIPPGEDLPRSEVGQRVLPAFESKAGLVSLVTVTTGEEAYRLVKNADGWVMPEKGNYPVDPARIRELTDALSTITYARPMTHDEKKFDRIGLGDPTTGGTGALLEVGDGSGANFAKLLAGYRDGRSYLRRPDDLQAWVVANGVLPPLQRAVRWLDLNVAPLKADEIAGVDVRPAQGPAFGLAANADGSFSLAPPYNTRPLVAALAPNVAAEALTRFAPIDVARATDIAIGAPVAEHITRTKSGVFIVTRSWKKDDRGWITISAATTDAATPQAAEQANAINTRAAPWAFALTELDWGSFSTTLAAIAD
ncbi:MAG TPA: DUF4340 domain-containing protein [Hyphomonadaceae bacterium]|jgi:hypothetical protein|nr:DUF4340 domain-containing protein [Hyphomonadaceae bacterium]HPN06753.1 DUF4340 domain-containing protein [Hyphomonadaceae bacterium]